MKNIISTILLVCIVAFCGFTTIGCKSSTNSSSRTTQVVKVKDPRGPRLFPKKMRIQKYNEQKGICPHCGGHFEFNQMQGDHIIPYSKGGKTVYENLQMLCAPCNHKKGNRYSY